MPTDPTICNCTHADAWHVRKVGPCFHREEGGFCGCDHFQRFRVHVLPSGTIPAVPMKHAFVLWSHHRRAHG